MNEGPTNSGSVPAASSKTSEKSSLKGVVGVIPARIASTRLPNKMLADISGKPMVVRTAEAVLSSGVFERVIVATDHEDISAVVQKAGFESMMTDPELPSGTARVAQVAKKVMGDVFVNIQGDEPLISAENLRIVVRSFNYSKTIMATLSFPLKEEDEQNPSVVKVVTDSKDNALFFSRSLIPFPRNREGFFPRKHLGVYGYRRETLLHLVALPACPLEKIESLEQLRALFYNISIRILPAANDSIGVDTPSDLERVRALIEGGK
ncbi:3-deoxy-manno-octulosonate cytidylyltransferase [bacterium]|nr:3-deoxy-manno-octulosonate cytidylyltransferase [bacterium]